MNKRLAIFDLNGVLIERIHPSEIPKEHSKLRQPDFKSNGRNVYVRPGCFELFQNLRKTQFDIILWSSAIRRNIMDVVVKLNELFNEFEQKKSSVTNDTIDAEYSLCGMPLRDIWDQTKCIPLENYTFAKPLCNLWKKYEEFNESNTVVIDDSAEKYKEYSKNLLNINTWTVLDPKFDFDADKTLYELSDRLNELNSSEQSVPEYLLCESFSSCNVNGSPSEYKIKI